MKLSVFTGIVVAMGLLLSGCGGSSLAIKPEAVKEVKKIALIKVPEPTYRMIDLGSPAGAIAGAIGAIAVVINGASATKSLEGSLQTQQYSLNNSLTDEIAAQLQVSGYEVVVIDAARDENSLLEDYSAVDAQGADAILDVVVQNAGYVTEHFMFSPEWRPEAYTFVVMHSTKSNEAIYEETIMYGLHNPLMSGTDLDAAPEFMFESKEAIFEKGDEVVVAGLNDAVKSTANQVVNSIRQ